MIPNDSYQIISYEQLITAVENDMQESDIKVAASFLIDALNDWPTFNLFEPKELIIELRNDVRGKLNLENLKLHLNELDFGKENNSHKAESLAALIELFDLDNKMELEALIHKITLHYLQK